MEVENHSVHSGSHRKRILYKKKEFVEGLREFHIREWKKEYIRPDVLDGMQWQLEIYFESRKPHKVTGSNAFPYNFREFTDFLKIDLERINGK